MAESQKNGRCRRFILKFKQGIHLKDALKINPDLNKKIKFIQELDNMSQEFLISYWHIKAHHAVTRFWSPFVEYIEPSNEKADVIPFSSDHITFISCKCICPHLI